MARKPTPAEDAIRRVYLDAERALQDVVADEVRRVTLAEDDEIEVAKTNGGRRVRRAAQEVSLRLARGSLSLVLSAITAAGEQGIGEAMRQLGKVRWQRSPRFEIAHRSMLDAIAAAVVDRISPVHSAILRTTDDAYREVVARVLPRMAAGTDERLHATQRALWALLDRGITGFVDSAGRRWALTSYVEMAVRTGAARAAVEAQLAATRDAGQDLVIVNGSGDRCPRCRPWHGKILSISGSRTALVEHPWIDGQYETITTDGTVREAQAAGLLHPQCRCSLATYTHGVTRVPPPARDNGQYEARQRQRAIERQIRAWKEREATALTPTAKRQARKGLAAAQKRMREHLAANTDLRRNIRREQIGAGNLPDADLRARVTASGRGPLGD